MHQPATSIDVVLGTAQRDFRHRPLRSIDEKLIECLRKPLPEAPRLSCTVRCARTLIELSPIIRFLTPNVLSIAYEFETNSDPFS